MYIYKHVGELLELDDNYNSICILNIKKSSRRQERQKWKNQFYNILLKKNLKILNEINKYDREYKNKYPTAYNYKNQTLDIKFKFKTEWDDQYLIKKKNQVVLAALDISTQLNKPSVSNIQKKTSEIQNRQRLRFTRRLQSIAQFTKRKENKFRINFNKFNIPSQLIQGTEISFLKHPTLLIKKKHQDSSHQQHTLLSNTQQKQNKLMTTCDKNLRLLQNTDFFIQLAKQSKLIKPLRTVYQKSKQKLLSELMQLERVHNYALRQQRKSQRKFIFGNKKQYFI